MKKQKTFALIGMDQRFLRFLKTSVYLEMSFVSSCFQFL